MQPPIPKAPHYVCATYIPDRSPKWKYHSNLGQAKNAANYMSRDVWIYDYINGELVERWFIPAGTKDYDMPWKKTPEGLRKRRKEELAKLRRNIEWKTRSIERAEKEVAKLVEEVDRLTQEINKLEEEID